ncbi:hypothetical protein MXB_1841 [Myxobolus squamalis]|nr:hypothetical protein MXB_1841 [Myxobolus squamalis]
MFVDDPKAQKKVASKLIKQQVPKRQEFKVKMPLFSHLIQMERNVDMGESISLCNSPIHPDFISFGLKCADGILFSSRARSIQLISCLITFINDYEMHSPIDAIRDLEAKLSPSLSFLSQCRPNSVGMATIIKYLKQKLTKAAFFDENTQIKLFLIDSLNRFLNERIFMAGDVISTYVSQKIADNDVILTYSMSEIILNGLVDAYKSGKRFKVVIIDTLPRYDGRKMLRLLTNSDIKCCYAGFNSLSRVMRTVSKIIIFGNSLMSNGTVLGPIGSSLITAVGSHYRVPVLVCCETYNVSDRAQTDSFVYNELGDPDDILELNRKSSADIADWKENPRITLLNLYYDIIQPKYVSAVVTELGIIPCSSAPVVLRVKS